MGNGCRKILDGQRVLRRERGRALEVPVRRMGRFRLRGRRGGRRNLRPRPTTGSGGWGEGAVEGEEEAGETEDQGYTSAGSGDKAGGGTCPQRRESGG